jgi:hypothetical protein
MMNILQIFMSRILNWILDHIPHARTRYKAIVDGEKIIDGCYACRHNIAKKEKPYFPEIHRCDADIDNGGNFRVLFDPMNIPEFCPFMATEVEARK